LVDIGFVPPGLLVVLWLLVVYRNLAVLYEYFLTQGRNPGSLGGISRHPLRIVMEKQKSSRKPEMGNQGRI
jgi:hypothetical protein